MRKTGEKPCRLTDKKYKADMKKLLLFMIAALLLSACGSRLEEKVIETYPNGQAKTMRVYKRNGVCVKETRYYENGQVYMEGGMHDTLRDGHWEAFFPDGKLQSEGFFKDGLRTGHAKIYYENGQVFKEGEYENGSKVGEWKQYDEQGFLLNPDGSVKY